MSAAAIYVRVSTERQTELSPDSQRKLALEYCRKNGLEVYDIYADEGISGRKAEKRPAFQKMIADAKAEAFQVVIVWKFSRFARNMEEALVYKNALKRHGVEVVSLSEPIPEGPIGQLIERIFEWMDEYYSINLSQEIKRGLRERASRGLSVGKVPFGYRITDGHAVPDEETAPVLREAFRRRLEGESYSSIALWLSKNELSCSRRWEPTIVRKMLTNRRYIGERPPGKDGELYAAVLEPLVDVETFEAVTDFADATRRNVFRMRMGLERSWLQGVVVCSSCGHSLTQKNKRTPSGKILPRLCCQHKQCTDHGVISLNKIEKAMLDGLRAVFLGASEPLMAAPRLVYSADTEKAQNRLKKRLERCTAAYRAGVDSLEEYKAAKAEITAELERLKVGAVAAPVRNVRKSIGGVLELLEDETAPADKKRAALVSILERAVFDFSTRSLSLVFKS